MLDTLVANCFARDSLAIALGGGVVGDLCGFTSACYQRGIAFGTAADDAAAQVICMSAARRLNHPGGKNLIGACLAPLRRRGYLDAATLPPRELRAGLAEVIKYGLVFDDAFLAWLESNMARLLKLDARGASATRSRAARASCKAEVADVATNASRAIALPNLPALPPRRCAIESRHRLHAVAARPGRRHRARLIAADMSSRRGRYC